MAKVTITDSTQSDVTLVPVTPDSQSAIVKYAQSQELNLILLDNLKSVLSEPLKKAAATPICLGMKFGRAFNFGAGQPQLCIGAGANVAVHVNAKKDAELCSDDLYQSQIKVKDGEGYLSLAFTGSITGGGSDPKGAMTFGFDVGASATFEFFRRFRADDTTPSVGQALGEAVSHFVIPADATDLAALRAGDVALSSGNRHLKVSGKFSASASAVPLASPNLPLAGKAIQLNASATVDVSANYEITSAWQIRTWAVSDGIIELGVYKQRGSDWDIAVTASAGIDASVGGQDLLSALIDKLSKDPEADKKELEAAGLREEEIKDINAAISKSIDRSIHASLSVDLNGLNTDEAAFLYRIDLAELNPDTAAAITAALSGDLTAIDRLNPEAQDNGAIAAGLTLVRSILTRTKKTGATYKMSLIGVFNFLSLADFISKSEVIHEPVTGDAVFKEKASGDRIGVITQPKAKEKLRKAIFDSVLMTTTYRSAGALETMQMECSHVHFAQHAKTNEQTMSEYLDWFLAVKVLVPAEKTAIMGRFHGTGQSTCTVRVAFDADACQAMFLDAQGHARLEQDYVRLGRNALQQLLQPGGQNDADHYREVLGNDRIWNQFQGQTTIGPVMETEFRWRLDDYRIAVLKAYYSVIVWWAAAMSSTAVKVVEMQDFLKTKGPANLESDRAFLAKVADVQKHVSNLIKNSPMSFDQPFGLLALDLAAGPTAVATGILLSPAVNREFTALAPQV